MGWSSWSSFHGGISEALIESQAAAMHATLQKYGYEYVNIDAGWSDHVDQNGRDAWDAAKFPDGIPAVAAYVHKLGLKFGIYLVPGIPKAALAANSPIAGTNVHVQDIADTTQPGNTAADGSARIDFGKPGADAYVQSQANLLASWGVDYIKMDFVGPGGGKVAADNRPDIEHWHAALLRTGRPIHLELSNSLSLANARDLGEVQQRLADRGRRRVLQPLHRPDQLEPARLQAVERRAAVDPVRRARPLERPGLVRGRQRRQGRPDRGREAVHGHPLVDRVRAAAARHRPDQARPRRPAADHQPRGHRGRPVRPSGAPGLPGHPATGLVQQGPGHSYTVALFNLGDTASPVTAHWSDLGLPSTAAALVRDLWQHKNLGRITGGFTATLAPHASMLLRITEG